MPAFATIALIAVAVLTTSTISGVFGMAGGLILLALLLTLLPVATAIAVQGAIQILANGSRAWLSREHIDWRILSIICAGLFCVGVILFTIRYMPDLATVYIVIGLLPILVWIPNQWLQLDASKPFHAFLAGFLGGGLNLTVGVAGPTIDIFFIRTQMDRRRIIATKAASQVISHAAKVVFYSGLAAAMGMGDWLIVLIAAPFAIAGTSLGYHILQRMTDAGFRKWTRLIVTAIGLYYLVRGLMMVGGV
ncbi:sulfite exporter TauE/SafE family protein [Devosia sp. MC532]|uniref:sulfite exporter TauE/SafE family protein n=1 Tax=Devosia sp. MC532 TaxID=2799788 RepID=UPI0018F504AD|nr:sulfite exporter TauE/SafE family protein [Devosia sp. MC532]MBJ7579111.1 sulfite exporter TauE/SafE family protein [Devosia sp. MC532]